MNSQSYLALNAWLQKADHNYMEGRLLWQNLFINGASNLLWLASEQIIKILLLQQNIDTLSNFSANLDDLHKKIDAEGKKLGHDVHKLVAHVKAEYPDLDLTSFEQVLIKLQEYFYRRYVVRGGSSISLTLLDTIDDFYFNARSKIHSDIGLGTIDEIYIQKKHNWGHPISSFFYAYHNNKYFRPREHRQINITGPDGKKYSENGL